MFSPFTLLPGLLFHAGVVLGGPGGRPDRARVEVLDRVKQYLARADGQGVSTSERNDCGALTCLALQGWAFILECASGPDEPWGDTPGDGAMSVPACLAQVLQLEWALDRSAWSAAPHVRGAKALAENAAVCAARGQWTG